MLFATLFVPLFLFLARRVYGDPFFCPASNPKCLDSFFNDSSILNTFLGDHDTVIFQNDVLKNGSDCAAMTVLFARGTLEPGKLFARGRETKEGQGDDEMEKMGEKLLTSDKGNVGILTGPPFFAALAGYMNGTGKLAIQGVDYPADIAGFLAGGSPIGATTM
jgi:cutinase